MHSHFSNLPHVSRYSICEKAAENGVLSTALQTRRLRQAWTVLSLRSACYAKNELASDLTSKILFAFLDHLPPDGLCNVCDDIIQARHDLRGLADYYVSNILVPSMFSPVF